MNTVDAHIQVINACNQRGGRMLSLVDLLDAGSVDLSLAAYLATAMRAGSSLLVGARPGGAGKTTVMCALLNFLPDTASMVVVDSKAALKAATAHGAPCRTCYVAHEIGSAPLPAYLWAADACAFFALVAHGHSIASNLHADALDEARHQLCVKNGVAQAHFNAVNLMVFIRVVEEGGTIVRREIAAVHESDGKGHTLIWRFADGRSERIAPSTLVTPEAEERMAAFISHLYDQDIRAIREVRIRCCTAKW